MLDTGTPRFQGDEFIGLIGSCVDITTQKQIEERQQLESVGTLVSSIAHEFNNLLGAVLVPAELALSEPDSRSRHPRGRYCPRHECPVGLRLLPGAKRTERRQ